MVRNFDDRPVPSEILERILANGLRAPSAGFSQGWSFLVLAGAEETKRYWDAVLPLERRQSFQWAGLLRAPLVIVALSNKQTYLERYAETDKGHKPEIHDWPTPYWHIDAAFAAMLMLLTATDAGLGALFFSVADIPAFRAAFGVPGRLHPIGAIAVGYPLPDRRSSSLSRGKRPQAEVVHRGRW